MAELNNLLGKKIQITNSQVYSELKDKVDLKFDLDYETLLFSLGNLSFTLAKYIEADADKVKFYSSVYGLGCINGGQEAFNYFNNKLQPGTPRIAEFDVMNHNLKKVFPDATTKFSEQDFFEFSQLYSGECTTLETKIIRIIFMLKYISQYYKLIGKLSDTESVEFIFNNMSKIIANYNETGTLALPEELYNIFTNSYNASKELGDMEKKELDSVIGEYNSTLDKNTAIERLNNFKSQKKNKIR